MKVSKKFLSTLINDINSIELYEKYTISTLLSEIKSIPLYEKENINVNQITNDNEIISTYKLINNELKIKYKIMRKIINDTINNINKNNKNYIEKALNFIKQIYSDIKAFLTKPNYNSPKVRKQVLTDTYKNFEKFKIYVLNDINRMIIVTYSRLSKYDKSNELRMLSKELKDVINEYKNKGAFRTSSLVSKINSVISKYNILPEEKSIYKTLITKQISTFSKLQNYTLSTVKAMVNKKINMEKTLNTYNKKLKELWNEQYKTINSYQTQLLKYIDNMENKINQISKSVQNKINRNKIIKQIKNKNKMLRKWISNTFSIIKYEFVRIINMMTRDKNIIKNLRETISQSHNVALTIISIVTMVGASVYVIMLAIKVLKTIFIKIKKLFTSKNIKSEIKSLKTSIKIYFKQLIKFKKKK